MDFAPKFHQNLIFYLSISLVSKLIIPKLCLSQLPGRLFSPSNISKKLSHHFLLHFPRYEFLWPPRKISGYVSLALRKHSSHKGPPLNKEILNEFKRGTHMKKRIKKTHPDILPSSHRNPYKLKNAIESGGTVFCIPYSREY